MNYYALVLISVVLVLAALYAAYSFSPNSSTDLSPNSSTDLSPNSVTSTLLDRDIVLTKVKDVVPNSYGLSARVVTSDEVYSFGVEPVAADGWHPEPSSRALFLSTKQEVWVGEMYLCGPDGCINGTSATEGPLYNDNFGPDSSSGPYEFSDLDEVTWKEGDEIHIWIKIFEEVSEVKHKGEGGRLVIEDHYSEPKWVDMGVTTVEPCIYEEWCPPPELGAYGITTTPSDAEKDVGYKVNIPTYIPKDLSIKLVKVKKEDKLVHVFLAPDSLNDSMTLEDLMRSKGILLSYEIWDAAVTPKSWMNDYVALESGNFVTVHGAKAVGYDRDPMDETWAHLFWFDNGLMYILMADRPLAELLPIAESMPLLQE